MAISEPDVESWMQDVWVVSAIDQSDAINMVVIIAYIFIVLFDRLLVLHVTFARDCYPTFIIVSFIIPVCYLNLGDLSRMIRRTLPSIYW